MKRSIVFVLCLLLVVSFAVVAFATESVQMTMTPAKTSAARGEIVEFSVSMSELQNARSAGMVVLYDESVFEYVEGECLVNGAFLRDFGFSDGKLSGSFALKASATMSGEIFSFKMKVKDTAAFGSATISAEAAARNESGNVNTTINAVSIDVYCSHSWDKWIVSDNEHTSTCSICGVTQSAAHNWDDGVVKVAPTCREEGIKTITCTDCQATKTEVIAKTEDHVWGAWGNDDASNHKRVCSVCEKAEFAAHEPGEVLIAGTSTHWYECFCGAKINETAHAYSVGAWEKDADNHWHACACGAKGDLGAHSFTEKLADDAHKVPGSTVAYYYDCEYCDAIGAETYEIVARGDMDKDGDIDEDDAIYLLQFVLMPDFFPID